MNLKDLNINEKAYIKNINLNGIKKRRLYVLKMWKKFPKYKFIIS